MNDPERAVHGDFHVIKMDGLFHVVFRPDADPEWFRIIASFYTYERAYAYCDIERVSVWTYKDSETGELSGESHTGDEELQGTRGAPFLIEVPEGWMASRDGAAEMVRGVMDEAAAAVPPHPQEDFSDQPEEDEPPSEYHSRLYELACKGEIVDDEPKAVSAIPPPPKKVEPAKPAAPAPPIEENEETPEPAVGERDLSDSQWSVLKFFRDHVGEDREVRASLSKIAEEAGVPSGSVSFLIEVLEKKGFVTRVKRGDSTGATLWRLNTSDEQAATADEAPRCQDCGGPRSVGSAKQCLACYRKKLADV